VPEISFFTSPHIENEIKQQEEIDMPGYRINVYCPRLVVGVTPVLLSEANIYAHI
jgi:hypothetical protein